ncbi:hypothetical protein V6N11_057911 [Hibiscus sabdariffa]|uniref:Uncharacterized protein n=2 Tax=Hibiscus sabdariffa TaxID=183260 RepID=A0ABR2P3Z4_9ROSI
MVSTLSEHESASARKVVSSELVVPVRVYLDPKAHVVVRVVETRKDLLPLSSSGHLSSTGAGLSQLKPSIRLPTGKGGEKKGDQARKKASGRSSSKIQLGEWIGGLDVEFVNSGGENISSALAEDGLKKKAESTVQWRAASYICCSKEADVLISCCMEVPLGAIDFPYTPSQVKALVLQESTEVV